MASCHPKKSGPPRPVESPYCSWGCFAVVLPWRFMVGTTWCTHGPRTFQVNCADGIFPFENDPIFWRPGKNNSCIYPTKKKRIHWAMDLYQKNNGYSRNTEKKLTIVPRTVFSRKNSMVWGCTTVLIKKENITYANHKSLNEDKNVQYLYPLSQIILRQTNTVLDFLLQYGRPCSPFLREILLVCHLQYSPTAFPTGPCNTHT